MVYLLIKNGDFPWRTVSHNQMVVRWFSGKTLLKMGIFHCRVWWQEDNPFFSRHGREGASNPPQIHWLLAAIFFFLLKVQYIIYIYIYIYIIYIYDIYIYIWYIWYIYMIYIYIFVCVYIYIYIYVYIRVMIPHFWTHPCKLQLVHKHGDYEWCPHKDAHFFPSNMGNVITKKIPVEFFVTKSEASGPLQNGFWLPFCAKFWPWVLPSCKWTPLVPEFCIGSASLLPSSPDHSVGVWRANQ